MLETARGRTGLQALNVRKDVFNPRTAGAELLLRATSLPARRVVGMVFSNLRRFAQSAGLDSRDSLLDN